VGARIDDAVRAAGGALPGVDLSTLNLAARLGDGQQVAVGVVAAAGSGGGAAGGALGAGTTAAGPVRLNSATVAELETLPGVGPVLAQHILDYRSAHGSFASVEQLNDVPGIGDAKFAALRDAVTL
jgi:competence protein ComEA